MKIADCAAAEVLAALHAAAFDDPWSEADLTALLGAPGTFALTALTDETPIGFILARVAADESEILTLAVDPSHRRKGAGRILVEAAAEKACGAGAQAMFLEVAEDNGSALALYAACGFAPAGRRRGYYVRGADLVDALALRRALNTASADHYVRRG